MHLKLGAFHLSAIVLPVAFILACNMEPRQPTTEGSPTYSIRDSVTTSILDTNQANDRDTLIGKGIEEQNPYYIYWWLGNWGEPYEPIKVVKEFPLNDSITLRFSEYDGSTGLYYQPSLKIADSIRSREAMIFDFEPNQGSRGRVRLSPNARFGVIDVVSDNGEGCLILDLIGREVIHNGGMDCNGHWNGNNEWVGEGPALLTPHKTFSKHVNLSKEYALNDTVSLLYPAYCLEFGGYNTPIIKITGRHVSLQGRIDKRNYENFYYDGGILGFSPNGRFLTFSYLDLGWVTDHNGNKKIHDRYHCQIIDLHTLETIHYMQSDCAGQWSDDNKWVDDNGELIRDPMEK